MATVEAPRVRTGITSLPEGTFRNEPLTDFSKDENRRAMKEALARVKSELGREYDLVIGGELVKTSGKIKSTNPARQIEVVGIHQRAEREHAEPAMKAALAAFE
jgi:1-pyrroline-5-carboxylate dehydrogenase